MRGTVAHTKSSCANSSWLSHAACASMSLDGPQPSGRERCCWAEFAIAIAFTIIAALAAPPALAVAVAASSIAAEPRTCRRGTWRRSCWSLCWLWRRGRWGRRGRPNHLEVDARDEVFHTGSASCQNGPSHHSRIFLADESRCRPSNVVGIIAHIGALPSPSTHSTVIWAGEGRGHMILCHRSWPAELALPPGIDGGTARHEVMGAVVHGAVQDRPIHFLADLGATCDHEPSLAAVVGGKRCAHLNVRARHKFRHSHSCL